MGGSGPECFQGMPGRHTRVPAAWFGVLRSPRRRFVIRVEAQIRNFDDMTGMSSMTVCVCRRSGSLVSGDYGHRGVTESSPRRPQTVFLLGGSGPERLQGMPGGHTRVPAASFGVLRSPKLRFVIRVEAQIRNFEDIPGKAAPYWRVPQAFGSTPNK